MSVDPEVLACVAVVRPGNLGVLVSETIGATPVQSAGA